MKLIDKSALVAEIEKLSAYIDSFHEQRIIEKILSIIDALEVKEVDLEKEVEKCLKQYKMLAVGKKDFTTIARHFFELGLKAAQKG